MTSDAMHISVFVHADWISADDVIVPGKVLGEFLRQSYLARGLDNVEFSFGDRAEPDRGWPVSVSVKGFPESGNLSDGFLAADHAQEAANQVKTLHVDELAVATVARLIGMKFERRAALPSNTIEGEVVADSPKLEHVR